MSEVTDRYVPPPASEVEVGVHDATEDEIAESEREQEELDVEDEE